MLSKERICLRAPFLNYLMRMFLTFEKKRRCIEGKEGFCNDGVMLIEGQNGLMRPLHGSNQDPHFASISPLKILGFR